MKSDLDALMSEHNIDVILVTGSTQNNAAMYYFTGGVHMTDGDLIKKRGEEPVLFYNAMERDGAAKTGMRTKNLTDYDLPALLKDSGGNQLNAVAKRYTLMLEEYGVTSGRIQIYGKVEIVSHFPIFTKMLELLPDLELAGDIAERVLPLAMATKDEAEIGRIRRMGQITVEVVDRVAKYLQSHRAQDGVLVNAGGDPLLIADVKGRINHWVSELNASNPHDCIFALGRDAGVPHNSGNPDDPLRLGETIVFDIFLQESGGGYHYDFTRTWCLGFAPPEAQKLYEDVLSVFNDIMGDLEANVPFEMVQKRTVELFEAQGHPTIGSNPATQEGYVHSIGHGLGLEIHEGPSTRGANTLLRPGVVVTIEPGLYYPERGMGVRLEDTVYIHPDGEIEVLAQYPLDLVLPIEGA